MNMKNVKDKVFNGERPLYDVHNMNIDNIVIREGESGIKECSDIYVNNSKFYGKYPFWHGHNLLIENSFLDVGARAAVWYSHDVTMRDTKVIAPKIFREASNITIENSIVDTEEGLWNCRNVRVKDATLKSENVFLHSSNLELENVTIEGKYSFQHVKNAVLRNCRFNSKDVFWNSENIEVYDSVIEGKYLAWYSKNIKFVNCTIIGTQPLCYVENLQMINCKMIDTDLAFELSTLHAEINSPMISIKNPKGGKIVVQSVEEVIFDNDKVDERDTKICVSDSCECFEKKIS
jgi:polygalacturonase